MAKFALLAGSLSGLFAVVFGAFGAHALKARLSAESLAAFQTGVQYQMFHALALVLTGVLLLQFRELSVSASSLEWAARLFFAGIILFSGSIYLLTLTDMRWPGPVTPMGGLCFIVAWAMLAMAAYRLHGLS